MPPGMFLIKPASSNCNMRCKYCFYFSEAEQRHVASYGMMQEHTLEAIVRKGLSYADGHCTFAFQGGEPTLAGLAFFEKLVELEKKYNVRNVKVHNAIQTNGILANEDWAHFFHENHFLVGLSLDGDRDAHNLQRIDVQGKGTFDQVLATAKLFDRFRVEYNILTVVTANTVRYTGRIYDFFKTNGFDYLQFIPCLDPLDEAPGQYPHSLKPAKLERFLKQLFDLWYADLMRGEYISIRYFDNLVQILLGQPPESCNMNGFCTCNCVIEADGSMYPCDFYMLDAWRLGNINTDSIPDMLQGETAQRFVRVSLEKAPACRDCRWAAICRGGCRREREMAAGEGLGLNYFCPAYRGFLDYAYPRLVQAAQFIARAPRM